MAGHTVTLGRLKELGQRLLDFNGQHASLQLRRALCMPGDQLCWCI